MRYIKEFKDIDWEDWDIEEDDPISHDISIGDKILLKPPIKWWHQSEKEWRTKKYGDIKGIVEDIKYSKDVDIFKSPNSGRFTKVGTKPECNGLVIMIEGHWPWIMLDGVDYETL